MSKVSDVQFTQFRDNLTEFLNLTKYRDENFVVTRWGKPCAVLVSMESAEKLGLDLSDFQVIQKNTQ